MTTTCRHCGQPIESAFGGWVHAATHYWPCGPYPPVPSDVQATYAEPAPKEEK